MNERQRKQHNQPLDTAANLPMTGKERVDPQKEPGSPDPRKPTIPYDPEENPDPTSPEPGINEPEINDPTRIDEPPPIFNNK
jgi:hypothetical protein